MGEITTKTTFTATAMYITRGGQKRKEKVNFFPFFFSKVKYRRKY